MPHGYGKCVDKNGAFGYGLLYNQDCVKDVSLFANDNPSIIE